MSDSHQENEYSTKVSKEEFLSHRENGTLNMNKKKNVELEELAKEFAANKVSAAGVSNIVQSRSTARRCLWFIAVMSCITFMGYMTVKVILEYFSYPKVLIVEDEILPKLTFPAVTLCSLNPISSYYVKYTSIKKVWDLKKLQRNFTAER
ncbi:Acid-sensing ion channel 5 like protein [Argiope bruennichi]|uniref:Acid-sensing ion channel 5 like protein n=1 Tax=Argiope bruennichi TaxID=94029 RepID=A0A8T0EUV3_ARGBR|nr:Acid-sensing ion channel 5 like protein [Argiope bruennichi]